MCCSHNLGNTAMLCGINSKKKCKYCNEYLFQVHWVGFQYAVQIYKFISIEKQIKFTSHCRSVQVLSYGTLLQK